MERTVKPVIAEGIGEGWTETRVRSTIGKRDKFEYRAPEKHGKRRH
jgi:hypothetical protein